MIKKFTYKLFFFIILIGFNGDVYNQTSFSSEQFELVESYTNQFPDNTQLSIVVINDNNVHFFGFIKGKDTLCPIENRDSVFEIGSITKVFTSTLLSQLILDKVVYLNEPIEYVLPFNLRSSGYKTEKVNFKTLANHTSGFPRMPENYNKIIKNPKDRSSYDTTLLKECLRKKLHLRSAPGEKYIYSNYSYAILGYLIEHIEKEGYEELLQKFICNKYKLKSTTTDFRKVKDLVVSDRDPFNNTIYCITKRIST